MRRTPLRYLLGRITPATLTDELEDGSVSSLVEILIQNGADPNIAPKAGDTPLHVACRIGYHQTVMTLLKHGASVQSLKKSWITPLHDCCSQGKLTSFSNFIPLFWDVYNFRVFTCIGNFLNFREPKMKAQGSFWNNSLSVVRPSFVLP